MKRTLNIKNDNRGFTLVEMAWIAFIMGILLLLAAPPVMNFLSSSRLLGASNELMSDMHYARSLATSTRSSHRIDFTANDYTIVEVSTAQVIRTRTLPAGYTYATTGNGYYLLEKGHLTL